MAREELEQLQIERLQVHAQPGLSQRRLLPHGVRRPPGQSRKAQGPAGLAGPALHHEGGPAKELSLRHVRRAAARHRPHPLDLRDHGQAHRRRLHPQRPAQLAGVHRPAAGGGRRHRARRRPDRPALQPRRRRLRLPPGRRADRGLGDSRLAGDQRGQADRHHAGLQDHGPDLHAQPRRDHRGHSRRGRRSTPSGCTCGWASSAANAGAIPSAGNWRSSCGSSRRTPTA